MAGGLVTGGLVSYTPFYHPTHMRRIRNALQCNAMQCNVTTLSCKTYAKNKRLTINYKVVLKHLRCGGVANNQTMHKRFIDESVGEYLAKLQARK